MAACAAWAEERREILEELRCHLLEKAAAGGDDGSLSGCGAGIAGELRKNWPVNTLTDELLARAEVSRSPFEFSSSLFRWASLSVAGFFVLLGSIMGYFLGVVFILVAALKPFHPETAGLWVSQDATGDPVLLAAHGVWYAPVAGREMLGWWVVPLGLLRGLPAGDPDHSLRALVRTAISRSRTLPGRG